MFFFQLGIPLYVELSVFVILSFFNSGMIVQFTDLITASFMFQLVSFLSFSCRCPLIFVFHQSRVRDTLPGLYVRIAGDVRNSFLFILFVYLFFLFL